MCDACDDPLEMVSRWAVLVSISADEGVQLVYSINAGVGCKGKPRSFITLQGANGIVVTGGQLHVLLAKPNNNLCMPIIRDFMPQ